MIFDAYLTIQDSLDQIQDYCSIQEKGYQEEDKGTGFLVAIGKPRSRVRGSSPDYLTPTFQVNKYFLSEMEPEENQLSQYIAVDQNQQTLFFNNLLQEANSDRAVFPTALMDSSKEGQDQAPPEPEKEEVDQFNLRSIEVTLPDTQKQDFDRFPLEKSSPEHPEEDSLQEIALSKNSEEESNLVPKRSPPFNRTVYLQQGRADKIARYKQKKLRRVWHRKISYDCRKLVADKRERKNGRFVRKEDATRQGSEAKCSWQTREGQPKEQRFEFKVQDYYQ